MYRTSSYQFTTENLSDSRLSNLRRSVSVENAIDRILGDADSNPFKCRSRVVVRARLGKGNPHSHLYRVGGPLHRSSSQCIRSEHGTRFDVYIHRARRD